MRRRRSTGVVLVTALGAFGSFGPGGPAAGQENGGTIRAPDVRPTVEAPAPVPFGPGERLEYQVKLGVLSVGEGYMEVRGVETVRGHPTYHLAMGIEGGIPFARVDDEFQSWLDTRHLMSRRFIQDQHEVRYKRFRRFEFYPEEGRWERADRDESGELATNRPLDDISFVYYVRTLPLEVGKTYTLDRYFKEDGNPVVIKVLRKDRIQVPAGEFRTIVVKPVIQTDGLFSEGGRAELHFTDDDRRLLVHLKSRIPNIFDLSLSLKSIQEGVLLGPETAPRTGGK